MTRPIHRFALIFAGFASLGLAILIGLGMTAARLSSCTIKVADQPEVLATELPELSPARAQINAFLCEGFQDPLITAQLSLPHADAARVLAALDQSYLSPQNHPLVPDGQKRRDQTRLPEATQTRYTLPGTGTLYIRTITLKLPDDPGRPASLSFEGWQF